MAFLEAYALLGVVMVTFTVMAGIAELAERVLPQRIRGQKSAESAR